MGESVPQYMTVLNEEQLDAVIHFGSPLLILAGAGSGKTRVITTKIAYLIKEKGLSPHNILAVTFTNKAAKEMKNRAVLLEKTAAYSEIKTFHSFGVWFLRRYAADAGIDKNFTIYDDDDAVVLLSKAVPGLLQTQAKAAYHKISLAKDYCLMPEDLRLVEIDSSPEFRDVYRKYEARLQEVGNLDFGDLILKPLQILREREDIRKDFQSRFKVILVDEYQDSNVAQFELLKMMKGDDTYLCVVGDDDQSIYKFRGAEINNILSFQENFANTEIVRLQKNYRSTLPILTVADDIISNNSERLGKKLEAVREGGKKPSLIFLPNQDEEALVCAEMIKTEYKKGVPYSDWAILYRTNAQSLAFETNFLKANIPYKVVGSLKFYEREEIKDVLAFLALTSNQKDEVAFRRIVNKPARGIGLKTQQTIIDQAKKSDGNLLQAAEVVMKDSPKKAKSGIAEFLSIFVEIKKVLEKNNTKSFDTIFPKENFIKSVLASEEDLNIFDENKKSTEKADQEAKDKKNELVPIKKEKEQLSGLAIFVEAIIEFSGLREYHKNQDEISSTQRVANMGELLNSAAVYDLSPEGLSLFLEQIDLDRTALAGTEEEPTDCVTLITVHNTKGLEFSRVIITGLEFGVFPREDKVGEQLEEERRLMYVGITRARDELYFMSCSIRRLYGRTSYMEPSPFLMEVEPDHLKVLGEKPRSYQSFIKNSTKKDGQASLSPFAMQWAKSVRVFHDDYGYGIILSGEEKNGEYVIYVQFENGEKKRFIPKYQSNRLMISVDE